MHPSRAFRSSEQNGICFIIAFHFVDKERMRLAYATEGLLSVLGSFLVL